MKSKIIFLLVILFSLISCLRDKENNEEIKLYDVFFCIVDQTGIKNEPDVNSEQIGSLKLFDMATIIEKTEYMSSVNGIDDFWYTINLNGLRGYVFGGDGVLIKDKYELKKIDDFANKLSSVFEVKELSRDIFDYKDEIRAARLLYGVTFKEHSFYLEIILRPNPQVNKNNVLNIAMEHNLTVNDASNFFDENRLKDDNISSDFVTLYGNKGRYYFAYMGSWVSYDIAEFLFETEFDNNFDGIIISPFNMWLDNRDYESLYKLSADFIEEARKNKIKESIIFQLFYEIVLRIKIE